VQAVARDRRAAAAKRRRGKDQTARARSIGNARLAFNQALRRAAALETSNRRKRQEAAAAATAKTEEVVFKRNAKLSMDIRRAKEKAEAFQRYLERDAAAKELRALALRAHAAQQAAQWRHWESRKAESRAESPTPGPADYLGPDASPSVASSANKLAASSTSLTMAATILLSTSTRKKHPRPRGGAKLRRGPAKAASEQCQGPRFPGIVSQGAVAPQSTLTDPGEFQAEAASQWDYPSGFDDENEDRVAGPHPAEHALPLAGDSSLSMSAQRQTEASPPAAQAISTVTDAVVQSTIDSIASGSRHTSQYMASYGLHSPLKHANRSSRFARRGPTPKPSTTRLLFNHLRAIEPD
jgi:hypothetical protein